MPRPTCPAPPNRRPRLLALAAALLAAAGLALGNGAPATAATAYPVTYDYLTGFASGFLTPNASPAGANIAGCQTTAAHPYPVVLVMGTFETMGDAWGAGAPLLANNGYCVYAFNYGGVAPDAPIQATGPIEQSAAQLAAFVADVLSQTGALKVDLIGYSQGGMMPRYYIKYLGGTAHVDKLVALAPSNNGTTLDGLATLGSLLGINPIVQSLCAACAEQEQGSDFLTSLNAGGETVPGIGYTVIETSDDEVVTPFTNAFLPAAPNVTNILLQTQCSLDATDHLEISYDPIAWADVLNALDPAAPQPVPCEVVNPLTGPAS